MVISNKDSIQAARDAFGLKIEQLQQKASEASSEAEKEKYLKAATFVKMKVQHTMFVQKEGMNIYEALKKNASDYPDSNMLNDESLDNLTNKEAYGLAGKYFGTYRRALLWHDLGRAEEFDKNADPTFVNHVTESKIISEKYTSDIMTHLVILNHGYGINRQMYEKCKSDPDFNKLSDEEQKACLVLSLLVRDADKLGNWKTFSNQGVSREVAKRIKPEIFRDKVSIGDYEMDCVRKNVNLDYSKYTNFSGIQVAHMMWGADIALKSTKQAAIKGGYVNSMLTYMDEVAQDDTLRAVKEGKGFEATDDYKKFVKQYSELFETFKKRGWINPEANYNAKDSLKTVEGRINREDYAPRVLTTGMRRYHNNSIDKNKSR